MATTLGISIVRFPTRLGRRKNSTRGDTKYAKKIESTSSRMIPVILEITHRTIITATRIKMRRRTTRVGGPDASTTALAAVIAVSLFCLFTVLTLLCAISVFLCVCSENKCASRAHKTDPSVCRGKQTHFSADQPHQFRG